MRVHCVQQDPPLWGIFLYPNFYWLQGFVLIKGLPDREEFIIYCNSGGEKNNSKKRKGQLMNNNDLDITLLGSGGGVARAILTILNQSIQDAKDPIHHHMQRTNIHLVDYKQKDISYYETSFPNLQDKFFLYQFDLRNTKMFKQHLIRTKTKLVIDVSWADTVEMLRCCDELGIKYINTAMESTMVDENDEKLYGFTALERYHIFQENKDKFKNTTGIVCSGMNPGVVQWMAIEMMKRFPDEKPLGCYIVENDSSFYKDKSLVQKQTVYSTWSPECFLDEAILNYPMFVKQHTPLSIYEDVYKLEFKVSLGEKQFYGCLMPHEEVLTLGALINLEVGFIYKVNDYTTELIRANLDHVDDLWEWNHKVLDPNEAELVGEDLVGVLLVYADKERYIYNVMNNKEIFSKYKVNATYFQVACGVYSALSTLLLDQLPSGIFYVDEMLMTLGTNYEKYLSYYMKDFVIGENNFSDGLLLDRLRYM